MPHLYVMQHIERGTLHLWTFLDTNENSQKVMKSTRIFNPLSNVRFECLHQF